MSTFKISNVDEYQEFYKQLSSKLDVLRDAAEKVAPQVISEELTKTLKKAVSRAPVEEGHLRKAGKVTANSLIIAQGREDGSTNVMQTFVPNGTRTDFEIGFWHADPKDHGAADVNTYSWIQHEDLSFKHPRGGQAKFLESAINEDLSSWKAAIRKAMKEANE